MSRPGAGVEDTREGGDFSGRGTRGGGGVGRYPAQTSWGTQVLVWSIGMQYP